MLRVKKNVVERQILTPTQQLQLHWSTMEEEEFYSSEEEQAYDPATPYVVDVVDDDWRHLNYNPTKQIN